MAPFSDKRALPIILVAMVVMATYTALELYLSMDLHLWQQLEHVRFGFQKLMIITGIAILASSTLGFSQTRRQCAILLIVFTWVTVYVTSIVYQYYHVANDSGHELPAKQEMLELQSPEEMPPSQDDVLRKMIEHNHGNMSDEQWAAVVKGETVKLNDGSSASVSVGMPSQAFGKTLSLDVPRAQLQQRYGTISDEKGRH